MRVVKFVVASLIFAALSLSAIAAVVSWGNWTDKEQTHIYSFAGNNELKFWGQKCKWQQNLQRCEYSQGKTDGVWQYQEGMCWLGDKKQQLGNVMIYADTLRCCMSAQFLGNKLVLSEVWSKGVDELGICTNRVLSRTQTLPGE
jgi:hypothetical protein